MSTEKGEVLAKVYELNLTPEQAIHLGELAVQISWNMSHEGLNSLETQLNSIEGVWDTDYDEMNVHHGVTITINTVDDTDELWEQINKTVETFLATPLAGEPDEDAES